MVYVQYPAATAGEAAPGLNLAGTASAVCADSSDRGLSWAAAGITAATKVMSMSAARNASRVGFGLWLNCVFSFVVFILIILLQKSLFLKDIVLKPISSSMSRTRSLARVVPRGSALPVCGNCWVCKTR